MNTREFVPGFGLALRFALRELRGGLRGFYIFLGCIALGVAAIGGVNSVANSITEGVSREGDAILGGNISFSYLQRDATPEQVEYIRSLGEVSKQITMRAMARLPDGSQQTLVELKAVDSIYPLYGELLSDERIIRSTAFGDHSAYAEPLLLERLGLKPGDHIEIGSHIFSLTEQLTSEPDKFGDNIGFGPRLMIGLAGLEKTGLIQPGSMVQYHYKVRLSENNSISFHDIIESAKKKFPQAGWRIRSSANAAPALSRSIVRFSQFLTLVGLTSLIVGGIGVANAIRAFLETKRSLIATLKSLGAPSGFVFRLYLIQILILAGLGILAGLVLAICMPYLARWMLGGFLPVAQGVLFFPGALAPGIVYGVLTTLIFSIWPLGVSRDIKPTELFRAATYGSRKRFPRPVYLLVIVTLVAGLFGFSVYFSENRFITIVFLGAVAFAFVLLRLIAIAIEWLSSQLPKSSNTTLRMAVANIHRPGSLTSSIVLSLGLGLALLVTLASIDGNLRSQIQNNLPQEAPDFFFVDIQSNEVNAFRDKLVEMAPEGKIISVPMLRGRIIKLKGIPASEYKAEDGGEWVLRGDRGITYAANLPENSSLSEGTWWETDYSGPPLVSVSSEEAGELGLEIGDEITVNVLGRNITAVIASFRTVEWERLGINFVLVFSPNTFAGAPHAYITTLTSNMPQKSGFDGVLLKELARTFPAVTSIRIRDALETINGLIGQLATAIRAAASIALLASFLVLAGALAAGNRERVHDAVILKTLGANRKMLMSTFILEYGLSGFATAIFAVVAGTAAAWFVVVTIMDFEFVLLPAVALMTVAAALVFTIVLGLAGTWHILGQKAAPILREL